MSGAPPAKSGLVAVDGVVTGAAPRSGSAAKARRKRFILRSLAKSWAEARWLRPTRGGTSEAEPRADRIGAVIETDVMRVDRVVIIALVLRASDVGAVDRQRQMLGDIVIQAEVETAARPHAVQDFPCAHRTEVDRCRIVPIEIMRAVGVNHSERHAVFFVDQAGVVIVLRNAEQLIAVKRIGLCRYLAVGERVIAERAQAGKRAGQPIEEILPADLQPAQTSRPQIARRGDEIVYPANRGENARRDDPISDVLLIAIRRQIVRPPEIIFDRGVILIGLSGLQVRIALRSAVLNVLVRRYGVVEPGVEHAEIGARQYLGVAGTQLQTTAEAQPGTGIGQPVGIAGGTGNRHLGRGVGGGIVYRPRPGDIAIGLGESHADEPVELDRPADRNIVFALDVTGVRVFLGVETARGIKGLVPLRNAENLPKLVFDVLVEQIVDARLQPRLAPVDAWHAWHGLQEVRRETLAIDRRCVGAAGGGGVDDDLLILADPARIPGAELDLLQEAADVVTAVERRREQAPGRPGPVVVEAIGEHEAGALSQRVARRHEIDAVIVVGHDIEFGDPFADVDDEILAVVDRTFIGNIEVGVQRAVIVFQATAENVIVGPIVVRLVAGEPVAVIGGV